MKRTIISVELDLHAGRLQDGLSCMEKAQLLKPSHYESGYDLALAYLETRNSLKARQHIEAMQRREDSAERHILLADVEEAAGDYVRAAQEYKPAARMEPSEEHIFAWGSELLSHQTYEPAMAVFTRGIELFPRSAKLEAGLGIALYVRGSLWTREQDSTADLLKVESLLIQAVALDPSFSDAHLHLGILFMG